MTAREKLAALYTEWRRLTEGETDAIHADAWERLAEIHTQKLALQQQIIAATPASEPASVPVAAHAHSTDNPFHPVVQELILLETRNAEILAAKRQAAEAQRADLDRSTQNLRLVQRSYGTHSRSAWHSYS